MPNDISNINSTKKVLDNSASPINLPETPYLKRLGYGTGVGVFRMDRSPMPDMERSPWALKKINKKSVRGQIASRLQREAEVLKTLSHPNIIGFRGYLTTKDGREVLAMEEGGCSLGDMIEMRLEKAQGPFPTEEILKFILEISKALHYIHTEKRIIHGDIKSFNVLVKDNFNIVKLCDFGVSMELNDQGEATDYVGTVCWSAPEVLIDGPITAKADIFSLGLTAWEMLSLKPPYQTEDSLILDKSQTFDLTENFGTRPEFPSDLGEEYNLVKEIIVHCTEEELTKRPTALDLINQLTK